MTPAKDTRLTFRVKSDLKKKLESVAASEGRSVAQICDAFLSSGLATYQKEGTKFIRRFLAREEGAL
jgi:predicted transcriptional regulator